jgi:glycogen synthase
MRPLTLITLKCLISQFKLLRGIINGVDLMIWSEQNKKYRNFNCPTFYATTKFKKIKK